MVEACPAEGDAPVPITPAGRPRSGQRSYPDRLDVGLLRTAGVCVLASVMAHVDVTVVSVAQRTFVADFGSTQAVVAWTMTGYMLALATVIPTAGWAADRFGTRRLFMGSVLAFTLGSLLCAVAPNILLLIIFRVVQGFGGGMLTPVSFAILAREAGPKRLGRVMAVVGIPMLLGPVGGPILGGWLIGAYGWRWIFLVNLPVGLSALVLAAIVFPRDRPAASENFDYMGLLLLSPGLATFLFGVSSSPARGTMADRHVLIPAITGLALIAAFVAHSWYRTEHPLIDMRLFQNRAVAQANMTMTVLSLGLFGSFLLLPSYLQQVLHQSPMQSGVHIIPQGLGENDYERMKQKVNDELKKHFRPEFLNRIDDIIVFHQLTREEIIRMVDLMISRVAGQLKSKDMALVLTDAAKALLAKRGFDPVLGARPLRRTIQREIEDQL